MLRTLLTLVLFPLAAVLPAQTAGDCTQATSIDLVNFIPTLQADQPFTAGVNQTYCVNTNAFGLASPLGTVSLTTNQPSYPFNVEVTDLVTNSVTTLADFGDVLAINEGQLYFIEIIPTAAGTGSVTVTPNATLQALGVAVQTVTITVEAAPLPVVWASPLRVAPVGKNRRFSWTVSQEIDVSHYELEADTGGGFRRRGAQVPTGGGSATGEYQATDVALHTDAYYRVRQTDRDGAYTFTNVVFVPAAVIGTELQVFPNPATDEVRFTSAQPLQTLQLTDPIGREVPIQSGTLTDQRLDVSHLRPGLYFLRAQTTDGAWITTRLVVR